MGRIAACRRRSGRRLVGRTGIRVTNNGLRDVRHRRTRSRKKLSGTQTFRATPQMVPAMKTSYSSARSGTSICSNFGPDKVRRVGMAPVREARLDRGREDELQGEAIAWGAESDRFYAVSEAHHDSEPIWRHVE